MKNILLIIIVLFCTQFTYSQDTQSNVRTPKNSIVTAWITSESSTEARSGWDNYWKTRYPSNEAITTYDGYSSTRRFNCHGYAWYMVSDEGSGLNDPRWIGYQYTTDEDIYMSDGSYIKVANEMFPGKVSWSSGDHSAITTDVPGKFISKWNEWPLMKHDWDDTPFGTTNLKYYVSTNITGNSSVLCSGATRSFSVRTIPDAGYDWSVGPGLSLNNDGIPEVIVSSSISYSGPTWIEVKITSPLSGGLNDIKTSKRINFWIGKPQITSQTPLAYYSSGVYNSVCNSQTYITNMTISGASNASWSRIAANPSNTSWYQTGNNVSFYFWAINQTAVFRISSSNTCGTTSYDFGFKSITCGTNPCDPVYTIAPNPAIDQSTIIINIPAPCDQLMKQSSSFNGYIAVYDNHGTLKKKTNYKNYGNVELDLTDLNNGPHFIEIYDGKSIQKKTILIQK
jgi:hypothetical protein